MEFTPTNEYREISLQEGLNQIQLGNAINYILMG